jgi:hypothetical protein
MNLKNKVIKNWVPWLPSFHISTSPPRWLIRSPGIRVFRWSWMYIVIDGTIHSTYVAYSVHHLRSSNGPRPCRRVRRMTSKNDASHPTADSWWWWAWTWKKQSETNWMITGFQLKADEEVPLARAPYCRSHLILGSWKSTSLIQLRMIYSTQLNSIYSSRGQTTFSDLPLWVLEIKFNGKRWQYEYTFAANKNFQLSIRQRPTDSKRKWAYNLVHNCFTWN